MSENNGAPSPDDDLWERYRNLLHAVQSGVAYLMHYEPKEIEPKHLRVGINSAMCNDAALVRLLVKKGIISEREYVEGLVAELEREVESYEAKLKEHTGAHVTLG